MHFIIIRCSELPSPEYKESNRGPEELSNLPIANRCQAQSPCSSCLYYTTLRPFSVDVKLPLSMPSVLPLPTALLPGQSCSRRLQPLAGSERSRSLNLVYSSDELEITSLLAQCNQDFF